MQFYMAILRRFARGLVPANSSKKGSVKSRRRRQVEAPFLLEILQLK